MGINHRYQVEFKVAGDEESWTIEAPSEVEATKVAEYEYPYNQVTIISVTLLGEVI